MSLLPGDVIEYRIAGSYRYLSVLFVHHVYREIIGLDSRAFSQPVESSCLLDFSQRFIFPLSQHVTLASQHGQVRNDLKCVPARQIEQFRFAVRDKNGDAIYWWLWDGDGIKVATDETDLALLPKRQVSSEADLLAAFGLSRGDW